MDSYDHVELKIKYFLKKHFFSNNIAEAPNQESRTPMVHTATICAPYLIKHREWYILSLKVVQAEYEGMRTKNKISRSIKPSPFQKPSVGIAYKPWNINIRVQTIAFKYIARSSISFAKFSKICI